MELGWCADCVSLQTEIAPVLLEFLAYLHLHLFTHAMLAPTWVSAQGFVGMLDVFLSRKTTVDVGLVRVERDAVSPSDHYPVCRHPLTLPTRLPTVPTPGNTLTCVRYKIGIRVTQ